MSGYFNNLSQQLFNKPLQECTVEEVEGLARQYPYFAPAQFLLLKKLDKDSKEYGEQFQRSILYYKNPLEFDYFIQNEHYITHFDGIQNDKEVIDAPVEEKEEQLTIEEPRSANEENVAIEIPDENLATENENVVNENEEINKQNDFNIDESKENAIENVLTEEREEVSIDEDKEAAITEGVHIEKELDEMPKVAEAPSNDLAFEPFHTVDYFASQGIKLSQAEATNDRLGKQLKSFTEWLKTMKRVQPAEAAPKNGADGSVNVVTLAEHSVKNPEVLTEAMAEVWLKQGNYEKAAEVYHKLSLLNPSKRAYFAAKIDELKKEN